MTRLVSLVPLLALVVVLAGCGAVFVGFVSNPGVVPSSISGTVTIVQLGFAADGLGNVVNVTLVTLVDLSMAKTMSFCGDQRTYFPLNHSVRADYTSGTLCATLVTVVFFLSLTNADLVLFRMPGSDKLIIYDSAALRQSHALG